MKEPRWISKKGVLAMHAEQLREHGGLPGIRDENLLDSALARPRNVFAYEENPSLFRLAASYAFGLAKNHPFVDGNKRIALVVSITFLIAGGWDIDAAKEELYLTFLSLAEGSLSEAGLASWLEAHAISLKR